MGICSDTSELRVSKKTGRRVPGHGPLDCNHEKLRVATREILLETEVLQCPIMLRVLSVSNNSPIEFLQAGCRA